MLHRLKELENINIEFCDKLRNVMSPCIARDLVHLKKMSVIECMMIEGIIAAPERSRQGTDDEIVFPTLMVLKLLSLQGFINFWGNKSTKPTDQEFGTHKVYIINNSAIMLQFFSKHNSLV